MKPIMLCCSCCHRHKCPATEAEIEMDSLYNVTSCKYYGEKEMNDHVANPFQKILSDIWTGPKDNMELPVEEKKSIEPEDEVEEIVKQHTGCVTGRCE